jgi:hypothetical protein
MTMNPLPPQAYTKDTLLKAYAWLMNQNQSLKEMATTPDILVSLYLKAHRDGDSALDRPSIQNFKNELRNLAGLMGELDKPIKIEPPPPQSASTHSGPSVANSNVQTTQTVVQATQMTSTVSHSSMPLMNQLDELSLDIIHEIRAELNLSSDVEALRVLIKMGYKKAKSIFN